MDARKNGCEEKKKKRKMKKKKKDGREEKMDARKSFSIRSSADRKKREEGAITYKGCVCLFKTTTISAE
jgi:hypothetical protein